LKKRDKSGDNFVDALTKDHRYAVLTKTGRIQILLRPTVKQLRKRGKRGWHLSGTVDSGDGDGQALMDMIQRAFQELEDAGEAAVNGTRKAKSPKDATKP
jgi:hypothetical protein